MRLTKDYFSHIKDIRQNLINIEVIVGIPEVEAHIRNARYMLGVTMDLAGVPQNPYQRAHNLRSFKNKNVKAKRRLKPETISNESFSEVEKLEIIREKLNYMARIIHSRLYLTIGEIQISHLADFISRSQQEVYLARCCVSAALSELATEEEDDSESNEEG